MRIDKLKLGPDFETDSISLGFYVYKKPLGWKYLKLDIAKLVVDVFKALEVDGGTSEAVTKVKVKITKTETE